MSENDKITVQLVLKLHTLVRILTTGVKPSLDTILAISKEPRITTHNSENAHMFFVFEHYKGPVHFILAIHKTAVATQTTHIDITNPGQQQNLYNRAVFNNIRKLARQLYSHMECNYTLLNQ